MHPSFCAHDTASRDPAPARGLSPAARVLLTELEGDQPPGHVIQIQQRRLSAVLDELLRSGAALLLEHGHVLASTTYRRCIDQLGSLDAPFGSRDAAQLWGYSHGRARSVLSRLVRDGAASRSQGRYRLREEADA